MVPQSCADVCFHTLVLLCGLVMLSARFLTGHVLWSAWCDHMCPPLRLLKHVMWTAAVDGRLFVACHLLTPGGAVFAGSYVAVACLFCPCCIPCLLDFPH